jgi:hypothetical protein
MLPNVFSKDKRSSLFRKNVIDKEEQVWERWRQVQLLLQHFGGQSGLEPLQRQLRQLRHTYATREIILPCQLKFKLFEVKTYKTMWPIL